MTLDAQAGGAPVAGEEEIEGVEQTHHARYSAQKTPSNFVDPASIIIVIPTLNEAAHIEACIRSLRDGPETEAALIVVADGGSADATREIVAGLAKEAPNLRLIDNPGRLQSCAVNRAAREMGKGCKILVRCDAHAVYPPRFALDVAARLTETGAASLVVPMDARGEGRLQRAVAFIIDTPLGSGGSAHRGGRVSGWVDHGHHAGFDLGWFRRLGGYDESFSHNEDAEYDRRLTEAGGRIWLEASIRLGVFTRPTIAGLARQYWSYGKGRARTALKHRMRPRLRQMIPVAHTIVLALSLAAAPFTGLGLLYPALYGALCASVSVWAAVRMRSSAGLWAGPALATMHSCWGAGFLNQLTRELATRDAAPQPPS